MFMLNKAGNKQRNMTQKGAVWYKKYTHPTHRYNNVQKEGQINDVVVETCKEKAYLCFLNWQVIFLLCLIFFPCMIDFSIEVKMKNTLQKKPKKGIIVCK